jgi:putative membrane protein
MKKPALKAIAIALSAALVTAGVGATAYTLGSNQATASSDDTAQAQTLAATTETESQGTVDETVYVISDADGAVEKVIVSDWLKDQDSYTQEEVENALPVDLAVTYTLDGKTVSAQDLAGKSGQVTIRFDYTNNQYQMVTIGGKQEKIYVPFAVITGLALDADKFTNVTVSSGKVLSDSNRLVVVGMAFPGLQEDLDLDSDVMEIPDYVEITADVKDFELAMTMTMATNSVFTDIDIDQVDSVDDLEDAMDQMEDGMDQLLDGAGQLYDGLEELLSGTNDLSSGVSELSVGLKSLSSNNDALNGGAAQVFDSLLAMANSQIAEAGIEAPALTRDNYAQVLSGVIASLGSTDVTATARAQVESAVRAQEDTVKTAVTEAVREQVQQKVLAAMGLTAVPSGQEAAIAAAVDQQMASEEIQATIAQTTEAKIQALIEENMQSDEVQAQISAGLEQLSTGEAQLQSLKAQLDSYNTFYQGLLTYTGGVATASAGAEQLEDAMPEFVSGVEALRDGALELSDGLKEFDEEGVAKLSDAVHGDLEGLLDRVRATKDVASSYQSLTGANAGEDGEVKFVYKTGSIESGN